MRHPPVPCRRVFVFAVLLASMLTGGNATSQPKRKLNSPALPVPPPGFKMCSTRAYAKKNVVGEKAYMKIFTDCAAQAGIQKDVRNYLFAVRKHSALHLGPVSSRLTQEQYLSAEECVRLAEKSNLSSEEIYNLKLLCYDKTKMNGKIKGV
jgi:hypothetical protein